MKLTCNTLEWYFQAVKNEAEMAGMREAHLRDAVALCEFLYTIEKEVRLPSNDSNLKYVFD